MANVEKAKGQNCFSIADFKLTFGVLCAGVKYILDLDVIGLAEILFNLFC